MGLLEVAWEWVTNRFYERFCTCACISLSFAMDSAQVLHFAIFYDSCFLQSSVFFSFFTRCVMCSNNILYTHAVSLIEFGFEFLLFQPSIVIYLCHHEGRFKQFLQHISISFAEFGVYIYCLKCKAYDLHNYTVK